MMGVEETKYGGRADDEWSAVSVFSNATNSLISEDSAE